MPQNTPDTIRLNKFIAQNGVASRRGADELVFAGRVTVNGQKADSPGVQVDPDRDEVAVDGKRVGAKAAPADITLMLHKPVETVTTAKDPQGRTTVLDLLPADIVDKRPFPVGRLDFYSEGLLLLTTDGDLCYRLTHPKYHLPKVYVVTVRGIVPPAAEAAMRKGMKLKDGVQLAPAKVLVKRPVAGTQQVEITLTQGINRQIRRMCEELGLTILRLKRVSQGPLELGSLKRGQWRELSARELADLKRAVGLA
ncbi:MAG: pseudouridine synthase [Pseudodesulfovibrio sp.]|jgi:23S rRNA pseudouridine2605 synthase|uniref:Pseudouridine synthase n=1 Tax=Pseudodesulfovibrio indicus TaxID=1716143 RepID=A0A126QP92_9BACT|nr:pseudouridine synthase [Pseudodesulfovibrio indicus]AMK11812.1 pseudouridine synthase [Pseudodesulfovibrio indicus]TDT88354.1 ribosomal large subunit pseudouridine synthase B [Pseudodesulfovibrio indicus]